MADDFTGHVLPPFPVDAETLDLLWIAIHPLPHAERTSLGDFLVFMSEMGGSDTHAVAEVIEEGDEFSPSVHVMRDMQYHEHDLISALITEIRRLRRPDTTGGQQP